MTIEEAETEQNKFAKKLMTDEKKFFMRLKMEYYQFLKCMVRKLIVVINNQTLHVHLKRQSLEVFGANKRRAKRHRHEFI